MAAWDWGWDKPSKDRKKASAEKGDGQEGRRAREEGKDGPWAHRENLGFTPGPLPPQFVSKENQFKWPRDLEINKFDKTSPVKINQKNKILPFWIKT